MGLLSLPQRWWLLASTALLVVSSTVRAQQVASSKLEFEFAPKTLATTSQPVWSLDVSRDGLFLVTGDAAGRVILRNTVTSKTLHVLRGHDGAVLSVQFSPNGELLASAGMDEEIRLWDAKTGRVKNKFAAHDSWITALRFSPDGKSLASSGYDKMVRLWSIETGKLVAEHDAHQATVRSLTFSPTEGGLVSGDDLGTIVTWNLETKHHHELLPARDAGVLDVEFSSDGNHVLTLLHNGKFDLWDIANQTADQTFKASKSTAQQFVPQPLDSIGGSRSSQSPQTARLSPDGRFVVVGTKAGGIQTWSALSGEIVQTLSGHDDVVTSLAFSPDGKTLYTTGLDGKTFAWRAQLPLEQPLQTVPIAAGKIWGLDILPEKNLLAIGGKGGFVEIWDLAASQRVQVLAGFESTVDQLRFSSDSSLIAAVGWRSERFMAWNVESAEIAADFTTGENLRCFSIAPDGNTIAVARSKNPSVFLHSLKDGAPLKQLTDHELPVYDIAYSHDGRLLATASGEWTERKPGRVVVYDAGTHLKLGQFDDQTHAVRSIQFHPDSSQLCALTQDGVLTLYDTHGMRETLSFKNGLAARPVAYSPDGRRIAVGLQNGQINIWNVKQREIVRRLQAADDVFALAFSQDGSLLVAADGNEFFQTWALSLEENTLARRIAARLPAVAAKPSTKAASEESP